jgi:Rrf2 family protein
LAKLAQDKHCSNGNPLSARVLADQYHLPLPLLMNALKELHRAGVLHSRRGANGGYSLAKPPSRISLREVIEALEGTINVTLCSEDGPPSDQSVCSLVETCIISEPIRKFNHLLNGFLDQISLEDLLNFDLGPSHAGQVFLESGVSV